MIRSTLALALVFAAFMSGGAAEAGNALAAQRSKTEQSCFDGNREACLSAGRIFARLSGEERAVKARQMFAQGCKLGEAQACHLLVPMLLEGRGGPRDLASAAQVSQHLCGAGSGQGCSWQANVLARNTSRGEFVDPAKLGDVRSLYVKACGMGAMDGCGQAGALLATGTGGPSDPKRGYALLERACAADQWQACANLAVMSRDGLAHDADDAAARAHFESACDGGIASACNDLGIMWMQMSDRGEGEQWRDPALRAFVRGCEIGEAGGCSNAARQLREGRGVPEDPSRAYELAIRGCDLGSAGGCFLASAMLASGDGIDVDEIGARKMAQKACDLGHAGACGFVADQSAQD